VHLLGHRCRGDGVAGDTITYTIVVSDTGLSDASIVTVVDTLPAQGSRTSRALLTGVTFNPSTDIWTIATLAAAASDTLTLTGTVPANAAGSTYTNLVTARSSEGSLVITTDTDPP
jgi:large repetitive protein